jgi:hypothetical protein
VDKLRAKPDPAPSPKGSEIDRRDFLRSTGLAAAGFALAPPASGEAQTAAETPPKPAVDSEFAATFDDGAITSLKYAGDSVDTEYVTPGARLGDVILRYRHGRGEWRSLETAEEHVSRTVTTDPDGSEWSAKMTDEPGVGTPEIHVRFAVMARSLLWGIGIRNPTDQPIEIGDLAIPLPINRNRRRGEEENPSPPVLKHSFISGDGSHLLWNRGNSVGPYLMLTPDKGTRLEYWESQGGYRVFIHSAVAGAVAADRGCQWRQPNTRLVVPPGEERSYAFTMRWADDYDHAREILVEQDLVDVHVVPGMTVPADLAARFSLRSNEPIREIEAEHSGATSLRHLGRSGDAEIYEVRFSRLGENRLTVRFGDNRHMHLEFFSTEPLETLIEKRAAFIAAHQHRDPGLWYDGLLAEWAMDTRVMLGPDNYDRIKGWRIYEVTCDDPGLSKPAFLASKNAEHPVQEEVDALDYYIENFVWGGLQRTTDETFSYGIYGIPDWKTNRESDDAGRRGRQHLWRIYDYPHITLMYLSLYRVAKHHTHVRTAMGAIDYLRRAYGTALAMFTIPWEIEGWSAYETGLMNELVTLDVIDALAAEGMREEMDRLRPHWDRKVRTFVNDRPDLFRSEYAFDTTGFEATHAFAKYALEVADPGGTDEEREVRVGWVDYGPTTRIPLENAKDFMEAQMSANVFCRGWLENAYYLLGSDIRGSGGNAYTLTYMSQMGGWSVLDYALHHADDSAPYLRLGYASFLSAWALMNTGTLDSDYGFWYPGEQNDGGAGGGFEPAPYGQTWLEQPHSRGSWYYSCEIDLGGGELREADGLLAVTPRDGVRRRFHAILPGGRLHMESAVDRFAAAESIFVREDITEVRFQLESQNPSRHSNPVRLAGLPEGTYEVRLDEHVLAVRDVADGGEAVVEVPVNGTSGSEEIRVVRRL